MNPKYTRVADRLEKLISEGEQVAKLELCTEGGRYYIAERAPLHAWLVKADNILRTSFGDKSAHFIHFQRFATKHMTSSSEVTSVVGILRGAHDDIEAGFLMHQEFLVAGIVLDSVLEQADELLRAGFKDAAAILCRVVLEDALRRLAREQGLSDNGKAAILNDALRDNGKYSKPQWRVIQSWLDIGNSAAHGKFSDYSHKDVSEMRLSIARFMAEELK